MVLRRIIEDALREYDIEHVLEVGDLPEFIDMYRAAIELANKYISLLDKMGAFEIEFFAREYAKSFKVKGRKLSAEKAIIASAPLFVSLGTDLRVLEEVVESIGENFGAVVGFSVIAGYILIKYVNREVKYYPWAALLRLLDFGEREAINLYQKATSGDFGLIIDIMSRVIGIYYHGSISGLINAVTRWNIRLEYLEKLLFSASYVTSGIGNLIELINLILSITNKQSQAESVETFIFELLNKISLEVKPAVLRRFLEMEETRRKIIGLIEKCPSALILYAVNRIIKGFLPLDIAKKMSEEQKIGIEEQILDKYMPNWKELLDIKTRLYLGVIKSVEHR